jgi:hypothetical protein
MQMLTSRRLVALFASVALIVAVVVAPTAAQEKFKVAGKMTSTETRHDTIAIGDVEGHIFSLSKYEGTNASTGESKFMDGAQLVNVASSELTMGVGPHHGYVRLINADGTVVAQWAGRVTTVSTKEGPLVSFEGTYSYTMGTGKFQNIRGSGTYKGRFTSKTEYTSDWEGEYYIEK